MAVVDTINEPDTSMFLILPHDKAKQNQIMVESLPSSINLRERPVCRINRGQDSREQVERDCCMQSEQYNFDWLHMWRLERYQCTTSASCGPSARLHSAPAAAHCIGLEALCKSLHKCCTMSSSRNSAGSVKFPNEFSVRACIAPEAAACCCWFPT